MTVTVKPLPDEHARDWVARRLALAGLGTINGSDRMQPPNEEWDSAEWHRRVLECVPGRVEQQCRALADELWDKLVGT